MSIGILREVLDAFKPAFTRPTLDRFKRLLIGAIVSVGTRTVSNGVRAARLLCPGHLCTYCRVLSQRRWSGLRLCPAHILLLLLVFALGARVEIVVDDTFQRRRGKRVWGKGAHRDAFRSSSNRHGG